MGNLSSLDSEDVIGIFNVLFRTKYNTILLGGCDEPLYQPSRSFTTPNIIYFKNDYLASALHEVAHWCLAGAERRKKLDYGYWYVPEGRSREQQWQFENAEVKPQALEWMFSMACVSKFYVSRDNFSERSTLDRFTKLIRRQVQCWCRGEQLPQDAQLFIDAACSRTNSQSTFDIDKYHSIATTD